MARQDLTEALMLVSYSSCSFALCTAAIADAKTTMNVFGEQGSVDVDSALSVRRTPIAARSMNADIASPNIGK